jgi:hypothetical protein
VLLGLAFIKYIVSLSSIYLNYIKHSSKIQNFNEISILISKFDRVKKSAMIQVDLPAAFTLGQGFALLSGNYLRKEKQVFTHRLLGPFNIYLTVGFCTGGMFLLTGWPAWEGMYKWSWFEQPFDNPLIAAFYILFLMAMVFLGNAGYMLGHYFILKGKTIYNWYGLFIGAFFTVLPFFIDWGVWNKIGTFAEIESGGGYPFFSPPFFYGWLGIMSYMLVAGIAFGIWFHKKSNTIF